METKIKKESRRSNAYPSITLKEAIELAEFIYKNSGHSFVKLEDIAKLTNKSIGSMSQKIGSAVQYGLLELKSGTGYRPSELLKRILKPINELEKEVCLIEAFKTPRLYNDLINRFDGSALPSEIILPNILERDNSIYDEAAKRAAQVFLENVDFLELRNNHNELVLEKKFNKETNNNSLEEQGQEEAINSNPEEAKPKTIVREESSELLKIEIGLTGGKKAIIYYPHDLSPLDVEVMKLQLSVIEKIVEYKQKPET